MGATKRKRAFAHLSKVDEPTYEAYEVTLDHKGRLCLGTRFADACAVLRVEPRGFANASVFVLTVEDKDKG